MLASLVLPPVQFLIPAPLYSPNIKVVLLSPNVGPLLLFSPPFGHNPEDCSWVWSLLSPGTLPSISPWFSDLFPEVGCGWRSTETLDEPAQLLRMEGGGFVNLP